MNYQQNSTDNQNDQKLDKIDILECTLGIYPDLRRVKVNFLLSSFLNNPDASLALINQDDEVITTVNIINIFSQENEITLHIPFGQNKPGDYMVEINLFYVQEEENSNEDQEISLKTIPIQTVTRSFSIQ
jgi:hypothetical protein